MEKSYKETVDKLMHRYLCQAFQLYMINSTANAEHSDDWQLMGVNSVSIFVFKISAEMNIFYFEIFGIHISNEVTSNYHRFFLFSAKSWTNIVKCHWRWIDVLRIIHFSVQLKKGVVIIILKMGRKRNFEVSEPFIHAPILRSHQNR